MTIEEIRVVINACSYLDYGFMVIEDARGAVYLQGEYIEPDVVTNKLETQKTRRWFLNYEMTKSELVQTVFKLVMTSMEHRVREWFHYKGKAVFGPHFDIDALYGLCVAGRISDRKAVAAVQGKEQYHRWGITRTDMYGRNGYAVCEHCSLSDVYAGRESACKGRKS